LGPSRIQRCIVLPEPTKTRISPSGKMDTDMMRLRRTGCFKNEIAFSGISLYSLHSPLPFFASDLSGKMTVRRIRLELREFTEKYSCTILATSIRCYFIQFSIGSQRAVRDRSRSSLLTTLTAGVATTDGCCATSYL
jgi:hypothetical protein